MHSSAQYDLPSEQSGPDGWLARLPELEAFIEQKVKEAIEALKEQRTPGKLWTIEQVADYLSVSKRTVETLIAEGEIRPLWIRGARRFHPDTIEAYLRNVAHQ